MSLSPTQRTLRALLDQGMVCAIVEKFSPYAGPHGLGQDFSGHRQNLLEERAQEVTDWLSTPGTTLELWG